MKQPADITAAPLRRALVRDLPGTGALAAYAAATRRRDLDALLEFTARRRLARAVHRGRGTGMTDLSGPDTEPAGEPVELQTGKAPEVAPSRNSAVPRLLQREQLTPDLLRLIVSRPAGFDYRPGQHVKMGLPGELRTYSLVSAPHEDHLEFFVELFPGGRLSQRLRTAAPGSEMAMGSNRAKGDLSLDRRFPNQLLVATVTGIAPYVSFVRHELQGGARHGSGPRLVILHGASFADELGYADELAEVARRHPWAVTYVPTVSRPESTRNAGWTGARGRVETQLQPLLGRLALTPANTAVFACGNPDMVSNVATDFRRRGFTTYTEPFD